MQAAIGSVALDTAREHHNTELQEHGLNILTVAFLAILITAPTGAILIGLTGPRLLKKANIHKEDEHEDRKTKEETHNPT